MNCLTIFALVLAGSAVLCQVPVPCSTPAQWEARFFSYDEFQHDTISARLSYDAIYKRERVIEEFQLGKEDDFYDVLYLYNQKVEYRYNLKTKECQKLPITREWRDYGIPANSTSLGESYIGSSAVPGANLLVTIWTHEFVDSKGQKVEYLGTWTYEACIPVHAQYFSREAQINTHSSFYDVTPGISNPNAFIPRQECLNL